MTERERWVVYPLLFLALGVALRDKIIKTTASQRIQTESLLVSDTNGRHIAILGHERLDGSLTSNKDFLVADVVKVRSLQIADADGRVVGEFVAEQLATVANQNAPPKKLVRLRLGNLLVERLTARQAIETPFALVTNLEGSAAQLGVIVSRDFRQRIGDRAYRLMYVMREALEAAQREAETAPESSETTPKDETTSEGETTPEVDEPTEPDQQPEVDDQPTDETPSP